MQPVNQPIIMGLALFHAGVRHLCPNTFVPPCEITWCSFLEDFRFNTTTLITSNLSVSQTACHTAVLLLYQSTVFLIGIYDILYSFVSSHHAMRCTRIARLYFKSQTFKRKFCCYA